MPKLLPEQRPIAVVGAVLLGRMRTANVHIRDIFGDVGKGNHFDIPEFFAFNFFYILLLE